MFDISKRDGLGPKCYFTSSVLSNFVDHDQIPSKKKPFSTVLSQTFNHTLDVVLPKDSAQALQQRLASDVGTLQYARVYMKLGELIEGDFFNEYIKSGNILMLSEGRPGIDHIFSLSEGLLRLEVDKPTFQRMGLEGKAISCEGRKHVKARYALELNLRLPSMVRGHKGFERIVWAFKNVLNHSLAWLFFDLKRPTDGSGPLALHQPKINNIEPEFNDLGLVRIPRLPGTLDENQYGDATELLEWLTLTTAGSPRVQCDDQIDSYLSRYRVPSTISKSANATEDKVQDLTLIRWYGFMPPQFIKKVLLATMKTSGEEWFAVRAVSFYGRSYTSLHKNHHTLTWEYSD